VIQKAEGLLSRMQKKELASVEPRRADKAEDAEAPQLTLF
jgi:hypothetical protein